MDGFTGRESFDLNDPGMPNWLAARLGPTLAKRRIEREQAKEAAVARHAAGEVFSFSHMMDILTPQVLRLTGLLGRGRANAACIEVTRNTVHIAGLPDALTGFTLLHLTDLHADISQNAMRALPQTLSGLSYDLCVITGDFRGRTYGPFTQTLEAVRGVAAAIQAPILAVLGNHDTVRMVPELEAMGIQVLLNEAVAIERDGESLWIAGVDDPHYYRTDDISAVISKTPAGKPVVLLAHRYGVRNPGLRSRRVPHAVRTYAWRPDLPAWIHSNLDEHEDAALACQWLMAVWRHAGIYIQGRWDQCSGRTVQLPAGGCPAHLDASSSLLNCPSILSK